MTKRSSTYLKGISETGDIANQTLFEDLIDSMGVVDEGTTFDDSGAITVEKTVEYSTIRTVTGSTHTLTLATTNNVKGNYIIVKYEFEVDCVLTLTNIDESYSSLETINYLSSGTYTFKFFVNPLGTISSHIINDITKKYTGIGEIINEGFDDITDFTNVGSATFTPSAGVLNVSGGSTAITNYLRFDGYGKANIDLFTASIRIKPATASATTYGIGLMLTASGDWSNAIRLNFRAHLESGANFGKIEAINESGSISTSSTGLTASTDWHKLTVKKEYGKYIATLTNETTNKTSILILNVDNAYPYENLKPPALKFSIVAHGGSHQVDDLIVRAHDRKNADILFVGDSITQGLTSDTFDIRWAEQISQITGIKYAVNATASILIDDVNVSEVLSYNAKKIVLLIGSNNVAAADSAATIRTKLSTLIGNLTGYTENKNLFVCTLLPRISLNSTIISVNSDIHTDYTPIDLYSPLAGNFEASDAAYSIDGIHPNFEGSKIMAGTIINALNLSISQEYISKLNTVNFSKDGKVPIFGGKYKGYRPESLLEIVGEETDLVRIANSTGDGGLYLTSIADTNGVFAAGATYIGGQWIAKSISSLIFLASTSSFYFYYNTGLTVGNPFTPTMIHRMDTTGMFFGGSTTPAARVHIAAGTTSIPPMRWVSGVAPSSPADGDMWFDGTSLKMRISGVTRTFTVT